MRYASERLILAGEVDDRAMGQRLPSDGTGSESMISARRLRLISSLTLRLGLHAPRRNSSDLLAFTGYTLRRPEFTGRMSGRGRSSLLRREGLMQMRVSIYNEQ
jgi:hypothetical protein